MRDQDPNNLIWVDLEMTGLDVVSKAIIEIAIVITDKELKELGRWPQGETGQAIYQPEDVLERADSWVKENLDPDLIGRVRSSPVDLAAAEEQALAFVSRYCPAPPSNERKKGCPLAGNSIGQDRAFLARYMPRFEQYTSYRNVDVSTIKELVKRWYPDRRYNLPEDKKGDEHLAMVDILDSIEELRHYRSKVFMS
jgi:oligoribonuclease